MKTFKLAITSIILASSFAIAGEPYPDVTVISEADGWKHTSSTVKGRKDYTWTFTDEKCRMQASDHNRDGAIDYFSYTKPKNSHNVNVWTDTDHDGFFDKRMGSQFKMKKIKVPELKTSKDEDTLQNPGDDTLLYYLSKSDLVVHAKITKIVGVAYMENIPHYGCEIMVNRVLKEDPSLQASKLEVHIIRFAMGKKDLHPLLKENAECILFLKNAGTNERPSWVSADEWFAIQYPSQAMEHSLKQLSPKKELPESAAKFLESIKAGIQKDFSLHVLYYDRDVEESYWSLLRKGPAKQDKTGSKTNSIKAVVISETQAKQVVDYLTKFQAFLREPYWGEGEPHQGWTVSLQNGESALHWYLGKDRHSMAQAKDLMGLDTILNGDAKKLWADMTAHSNK